MCKVNSNHFCNMCDEQSDYYCQNILQTNNIVYKILTFYILNVPEHDISYIMI